MVCACELHFFFFFGSSPLVFCGEVIISRIVVFVVLLPSVRGEQVDGREGIYVPLNQAEWITSDRGRLNRVLVADRWCHRCNAELYTLMSLYFCCITGRSDIYISETSVSVHVKVLCSYAIPLLGWLCRIAKLVQESQCTATPMLLTVGGGWYYALASEWMSIVPYKVVAVRYR